MKKEKFVKIELIPTCIEIPITVAAKPIRIEFLENKNLWKIVAYSSLLEFYGKERLKKYFESHKVEQKAWLKRLERLSLGQVGRMLKELQLIDNATDRLVRKIVEVRNKVVHSLITTIFEFDEADAEDVAIYTKQCISKLI